MNRNALGRWLCAGKQQELSKKANLTGAEEPKGLSQVKSESTRTGLGISHEIASRIEKCHLSSYNQVRQYYSK
jgi:hypothetical protein